MNHCKTCKWWEETKQDEYRNGGHELIFPYRPDTQRRVQSEKEESLVYGHLIRYCGNPKILFYQRPTIDGAAVVDGSEYAAALITAEEFGCVLHEEINEPI